MRRAFVSWRTWQLKLALLAQPQSSVVDLLRGTCRGGSTTSPFKVESERTYDVQVPGHDRLENDRVVTEVPFVPPHESIEEELAASVAAADTLAKMCREQELPQTHFQHPVVRSSAPGTVWPLAIYVEGTPFSKLDSILGMFVVNIVTSSRHLVGTLQKTGICKCGCNGWCSIFCVMEFVKWSCLTMTSGMWPTARHDGKP